MQLPKHMEHVGSCLKALGITNEAPELLIAAHLRLLCWEGFCTDITVLAAEQQKCHPECKWENRNSAFSPKLAQRRHSRVSKSNLFSNFLKNWTYSFTRLFLSLRRVGKWNHLPILIFKVSGFISDYFTKLQKNTGFRCKTGCFKKGLLDQVFVPF